MHGSKALRRHPPSADLLGMPRYELYQRKSTQSAWWCLDMMQCLQEPRPFGTELHGRINCSQS